MKKVLTTMAVLTVIATPAFAQYDPEGNLGQVTQPEDGYYSQTTPRLRHRDAARAQARAVPDASDAAYDSQGNVVGSDPDPNVRLQMRMDQNSNYDE